MEENDYNYGRLFVRGKHLKKINIMGRISLNIGNINEAMSIKTGTPVSTINEYLIYSLLFFFLFFIFLIIFTFSYLVGSCVTRYSFAQFFF